jgi:hypothetical protein
MEDDLQNINNKNNAALNKTKTDFRYATLFLCNVNQQQRLPGNLTNKTSTIYWHNLIKPKKRDYINIVLLLNMPLDHIRAI